MIRGMNARGLSIVVACAVLSGAGLGCAGPAEEEYVLDQLDATSGAERAPAADPNRPNTNAEAFPPGCDHLVFDFEVGTLNGLSPTATQDEVRAQLPCSTGGSNEGEPWNYGGGVFFLRHDMFAYTGNDFLEVRESFRGEVRPLPLLGRAWTEVVERLGPLHAASTNDGPNARLFFERPYGCLRIQVVEGTIREIGVHATTCERARAVRDEG